MKKNFGIVLTAAVLFSGLTGWAQNANAPKYTINYSSAPTINGELSDWSKAEWVTYDKNTVANTFGHNWNDPNAVCTFATMYNKDALFCAAEVQDDVISHVNTTTAYAWWERDGVQWFIDFTNSPEQEVFSYPDFFERFEAAGEWLPGEMIVDIGASEDQTVETTRRWCVGTRLGSRSDSFDKTLDDGTVVRGEVNEAWDVVVKITGGKYTIEAKIPWTSIEKSKYYSDPDPVPADVDPTTLDKLGWKPMLPDPLAGSKITFTHLCIDTDLPAGGFQAQAMWVGDGDNDANWTVATFGASTPVETWEVY